MRNRTLFACYFLIFTLVLALQNGAHADTETIHTLIDNGKLRINAWTEPAGDIIATQPVDLVIEVSTPTRFTDGTVIGDFEVENTIILPPDKFAVNFSRREKGTSWSVQQWRLKLYMRDQGIYTVPPIPVRISVANRTGGNVTAIIGTVTTPPLTITTTAPPEMEGFDNWVAAPSLTVEETVEGLPENAILKAGDTITRRITIRGDNVPGMLLPALPRHSIAGLGIYPETMAVAFRRNRGAGVGIREETITYVVEKEGHYELPELRFHWWDLKASEPRSVILPGHEFHTPHSTNLTTMITAAGKFLRDNAMPVTVLILALMLITGLVRNRLTRHFTAFMIHYARRDYPFLFQQVILTSKGSPAQFTSIRSNDYLQHNPGFGIIVGKISQAAYAGASSTCEISWMDALKLFYHLQKMQSLRQDRDGHSLQLN